MDNLENVSEATKCVAELMWPRFGLDDPSYLRDASKELFGASLLAMWKDSSDSEAWLSYLSEALRHMSYEARH